MHLGENLADRRMHVLSLFGRRGLTRADRPDRLVSDYDTFRVGESQTGKALRKLGLHNSFRIAGFPLAEHFPNTNDGHEASGNGCLCPTIHGLVGLTVKLPPLAMS